MQERARIALHRLSLQDVHEIRLLLGGGSVIDWHRLGLRDEGDVRRLLALNSIDIDDPGDLERLEALRTQGVRYVTDNLGLRLDEQVTTKTSCPELMLLASGASKYQRQACTLLKVMHIIYHLDARERLTALAIPAGELFEMVEQSVVGMFDELRGAGVPLVEFSWSRKTRDSQVTKLLVKRENSAARVFDRLRFRLVVERAEDILPTLHIMLQRFIPFNYILPGQTANSLVSTGPLQTIIDEQGDYEVVHGSGEYPAATAAGNEFSGKGYQILNFVADLPVRVDELPDPQGRLPPPGSVVFVLAEFQVVDKARSQANDTGDNSHAEYKRRQHQRVRERLLREPRGGG